MKLNIEKLLIVTDEKSRDLLRKAYDIAWNMSEDTSTKTGAIILQNNNSILGYNHLTPGVEEIPEWRERPLKYDATVHAEIDVITRAAKYGLITNNSTMAMPWIPCCNCYVAMKNSGINLLIAHKEMIEMSPPHWEENLNKTLFLAEKDKFEIRLYSGKIGGVKSLFNGNIWEP